MAYLRGSAAVCGSWKALGNDGWGWSDVEPCFVKVFTGSRAVHRMLTPAEHSLL